MLSVHAGMAPGPLDAALGARDGADRQQGVGRHEHGHDMGMWSGRRPQHCAHVRGQVQQLLGSDKVPPAGTVSKTCVRVHALAVHQSFL
jgi:hypothetical protein